ncbi:M48 family metalloprotease [Tepidamorphus sp. 3E244]|uniref:M48 family metalloprotease n=1 Tax=Tepidamorphus sp. 3E244 TaxID=3385498 RepID=UPI0038FC512D
MAAVVCAGLLVSACASLDVNNPGFLAGADADRRDARIGARENPRVLAAFGGPYASGDLNSYVQSVTGRLAEKAASGPNGYKVTLLNSPSINAFSLPGGYIYVTRGLLALANNEAELAAVIAHEMAHIDSRHGLQRQRQAVSATAVGKVIADMSRGPGSGDEGADFARSQVAQFSRQQELEADAVGIRIMAKAGYDPRAAAQFLTSLDRQNALHSRMMNRSYDPSRVDLTASHPTTPQRIAAAESDARTVLPEGGGERNEQRYLSAIEGILYGDDPSEGYVRDRTFLHPRLGITFTMPDSYGVQNAPNAVVGFAPDGAIMRFDGIEVPARRTLLDHLKRNAVSGGTVQSISGGEVNGREAAFAVANADSWQFRIALIRGRNNEVYRFIHATQKPAPNDEADFANAVNTFRYVDQNTASSVSPLRVRIAQVRPGDTAVTIANRMSYSDMRLERFLTLNGIQPGQSLRPGEKVKVIAER